MDLMPFHSKYFGEHPFNQVVPQGSSVRSLFALRGQTQTAICLSINKAVLFEPLDSLGDGWRRNLQPVSQESGDDDTPLTVGFEDSLEVVLFGDCDLFGHDD